MEAHPALIGTDRAWEQGGGTMRLIPASLALLLTGCQLGSGLYDGFEQDLTKTGGCADLYAFATNDDDTILLEVQLDKPLDGAGGVPETFEVTLPDPFAEISVDVGSRISDAACDDLIENGGPQVRETWTAISGSLTAEVRPGDETTQSAADVTLTDIVFESPDGEQVTLESFSWTELTIGWFAG
jgi:hypothetical protein